MGTPFGPPNNLPSSSDLGAFIAIGLSYAVLSYTSNIAIEFYLTREGGPLGP
jgi:hypothetical protein